MDDHIVMSGVLGSFAWQLISEMELPLMHYKTISAAID